MQINRKLLEQKKHKTAKLVSRRNRIFLFQETKVDRNIRTGAYATVSPIFKALPPNHEGRSLVRSITCF